MMTFKTTRRSVLAAAGLIASAAAFPALAQDKPKLRFSAVFSEQDIRADMMKQFAEEIAGDLGSFAGGGEILR